MARIIHVIKNLDMGGTTKTGQLFCRYLVEHTDNEVFVLFNLEGDRARYDLFAEFMPEATLLPFVDEQSCDDLIVGLHPDIVHVYRSGQPEWPYPSPNYKFVETNVFGFFNADPNIDKTLYMSKWLMDAVLKELDPDNNIVTGKTSRFDFVNNPTLPPANKMFDYEENAIWLGRCGRPDDGIYDDVSVKAAWLLRSKGHDVRFAVMSPPPRMINDLEQYDIPYRNIDPTVDENELSRFYNFIDIYAHARADGETFGNNIAEAMYHGKPVVTHVAVPSHPGMGVFQSQTTLVTEETGFVVNHSIPEYAAALEKLILNRDLRDKMGVAGYVKAMAEFDWRISGMKLCKVYEELLT